jgi:hypothetical protein
MRTVVRLVIMFSVTGAAVLGGAAAAYADMPTAVEYAVMLADGYYSPNGNGVTWPVGPSGF